MIQINKYAEISIFLKSIKSENEYVNLSQMGYFILTDQKVIFFAITCFPPKVTYINFSPFSSRYYITCLRNLYEIPNIQMSGHVTISCKNNQRERIEALMGMEQKLAPIFYLIQRHLKKCYFFSQGSECNFLNVLGIGLQKTIQTEDYFKEKALN